MHFVLLQLRGPRDHSATCPQASRQVHSFRTASKGCRRHSCRPVRNLRRVWEGGRAGGAGHKPAAAKASAENSGDWQPGDVLGGKYKVLDVLGSGSSGTTYKCTSDSGDTVAVKALSLRGAGGWKKLELFEREAKALQQLQHPCIPRYIEYFEVDSPTDRDFLLVQELAPGQSLGRLIDQGQRFDEEQVIGIATQLLQLLQYLGSRRPPVVHRDIKPSNLVLDSATDGGASSKVFLVDFGGVQATAAGDASQSQLGSTVIGTYGFMAPEQFRGQASPASDLYALGATLLALLSGKPPTAFPQDRMRINVGAAVDVSPRLAAVLEGLLDPLVEDRLGAQDALDILTGTQASLAGKGSQEQPPGAQCTVKEAGGQLTVSVPPAPLLSRQNVGTASFALAWNAGIGVWTASALAAGSVIGAAFSLPFWVAGASIAQEAFGGFFTSDTLEIGPRRWTLTRAGRLPGKTQLTEGRTADLQGVRIVTTSYTNGVPRTCLEIVDTLQDHKFASGLPTREQQWLAARISSYLSKVMGRDVKQLPDASAAFAPSRADRDALDMDVFRDHDSDF